MSADQEDYRREKTGRFRNVRGSNAGVKRSEQLSDTEFSTNTIDLKWGKLFYEGNPTPRLGQFLRGLANHMIKDFQPKSIVVTPYKMAVFYAKYTVDPNAHNLKSIFKSQPYDFLSRLYHAIKCEYYLIPESPGMPPTMPGLTPDGFAQWMITWILAYPNQEATRLEKIVENMPIDADVEIVYGKPQNPERLPKQISRHLLPAQEDHKIKRTLDRAIREFLENSRTRESSIHTPLSTQSRPIDPQMKSSIPQPGNMHDHDRRYSLASDTTNIEKNRQPGNGKVYMEETLRVPHATRRTQSSDIPQPQPQPYETQRGPPPQNYCEESNTRPIDNRRMPSSNRFSYSGPASNMQPYTITPGQNGESLRGPRASIRASSISPLLRDSEPQVHKMSPIQSHDSNTPYITIPRRKEAGRGQFPPLANPSNLDTSRNYFPDSTSNTTSNSPLPQHRDNAERDRYENRWSSYLLPSTTIPRDLNPKRDRQYESASRRRGRGDKGGLFSKVGELF